MSKDLTLEQELVKGDRLFLQIPALPAHVGQARHSVVEFLRHQGWQQNDTDDVMLAVGEAGTNAVRYGCGEDTAAVISIICTLLSQRRLEIEVRNRGEDFEADLACLCTLPERDATHGRGFALMSALMDDVQVRREGPETIVRLTKSRTL